MHIKRADCRTLSELFRSVSFHFYNTHTHIYICINMYKVMLEYITDMFQPGIKPTLLITRSKLSPLTHQPHTHLRTMHDPVMFVKMSHLLSPQLSFLVRLLILDLN